MGAARVAMAVVLTSNYIPTEGPPLNGNLEIRDTVGSASFALLMC